MTEKHSQDNFDLDELKKQMNQIKEASSQAKKEYEEKKDRGEDTKQPLGKTIVGVIILIAIVVGIGFIFISNLDMLLLPKNSITVVVTDDNGEAINGLKIDIYGAAIYNHEFEDNEDLTILDAKPGDYNLVFEYIPEGYFCSKTVDNFNLKQDGKIKLEYKCTKEN